MATLPPLRLFILLLAIGSVGTSLVGCGSGGNGEKLGERVIPLGQPVPKGGGRYATGVAYKVDGFYNKAAESGLRWDDPDIAIDWPIAREEIMVSDKDAILPYLRDATSFDFGALAPAAA